MSVLKFTAEQLATEIHDMSQRTLAGIKTLGNLDTVEVGTTPNDIIYQQDKLQLRYYAPKEQAPKEQTPKQQAPNEHTPTEHRHAEIQATTPLLIVYALVNRPYILDLQPDRSLIAALQARGIPVYLIDWGYPDRCDRYLDLDDYLNDYLDSCVDMVRQHSQQPQTNLLGVCQGGTFSLCYSALYPSKVRNLITLVTPVDFQTPDNILSALARNVDAKLATDTFGNYPGELMTRAYNALMPMRLGLHKELNLPDQLDDTDKAATYLRMERWINDSPDLAGSAFEQFMRCFFQQNQLIKGGLRIGGKSVDLKRQTQPLLNLYAAKDHLVPPAASRALAKITGSKDYLEKEYPGGHIGVFVGRQAQEVLPDDIAGWLKARD